MTFDAFTDEKLKIGRRCLLTFIAITLGFDAVTKMLGALLGTLRYSQIGGTVLTLVLMIFLWRGSRAAWWLTILCLFLAAIFALYVTSSGPTWLGLTMLTGFGVLALLILLPSTRAFIATQRDKNA